MDQKTDYAAPSLRETVDARAYSIEDPPTKHNNDITTKCNGTPTEDWLRRQAIATIERHNAKSEQQKEYPEWIKDSDDQYMTTKRHSHHQTKQESMYLIKTTDVFPGTSMTSPLSLSKNSPLHHPRIKIQTPMTNHAHHRLQRITFFPRRIPRLP